MVQSAKVEASAVTSGKATLMKFKSKDIPLENLLLDPNNYRFHDNKSYKPKPKGRYGSKKVQAATLRLLEQDKRYQLAELKKSILRNGYVPMERIIVVPLADTGDDGTFLVIEGNRRVAALKSLCEEDDEGVIELSKDQRASFSTVPCAILDVPAKDRSHAERVIMGIRHITGPREWGPYQQAQLVKELYDEEEQDFASIGEHLGISTVEVARRYRAITALKGMEQDELYGTNAEPEYYRFFHELVSLPEVRERFGWDSDENRFTDEEKAREFFELLAPQSKETGEAKIKTYSDVRKLKLIVGKPEAEEVLTDPSKTFADALAEAAQTQDDRKIEEESLSQFLREALERVRRITRAELKEMSASDKKSIKELIAELKDVVE